MKKYEIVKVGQFEEEVIRQTNEDGTEYWIPQDPANSDYQAYLRWLNGEEENGTIS